MFSKSKSFLCWVFGLSIQFLFLTSSLWPKSYIDERSGIAFSFEVHQGMFPSSWGGGNIQGQAQPIDPEEIERSLELFQEAMAEYPVEILKKNLKKIYVVGSLKFFGVPYGATNSDDTLYFTNRGIGAGFSDSYLIRSFHHEFSSILLRNFPSYLDQSQWSSNNPQGFQYGGSGADAIRNKKASTKISEEYLKIGFLSQYALSNFENDLNLIAEQLFFPEENFSEILKNHEALRNKVKLAVGFYQKIHPQFSFDFFELAEIAEDDEPVEENENSDGEDESTEESETETSQETSDSSVNGKYTELLSKIHCPQDQASYGNFNDYGFYSTTKWCGQAATPGFWVYVYPSWYIWRNKVK